MHSTHLIFPMSPEASRKSDAYCDFIVFHIHTYFFSRMRSHDRHSPHVYSRPAFRAHAYVVGTLPLFPVIRHWQDNRLPYGANLRTVVVSYVTCRCKIVIHYTSPPQGLTPVCLCITHCLSIHTWSRAATSTRVHSMSYYSSRNILASSLLVLAYSKLSICRYYFTSGNGLDSVKEVSCL